MSQMNGAVWDALLATSPMSWLVWGAPKPIESAYQRALAMQDLETAQAQQDAAEINSTLPPKANAVQDVTSLIKTVAIVGVVGIAVWYALPLLTATRRRRS